MRAGGWSCSERVQWRPRTHSQSVGEAGCECVAHILQTFTNLDPQATIMSIDGVGAYDLTSRNAMLAGLLRMEGGDQILPSVRCFYGEPIHRFMGGRDGQNPVHPTRRRGAGRPLMSLLFALVPHRALEAIHERMGGVLGYIYPVCRPGRFGTGKCSSCSSRCTLGKLGRFPPNGQTEKPSHRNADDQTVGG